MTSKNNSTNLLLVLPVSATAELMCVCSVCVSVCSLNAVCILLW